MRPAELYGLRWSDIDVRADEIHVERQYSASTRSFELSKNGKTRMIVLTAPAKAGLLANAPADGRRRDGLLRQEGRCPYGSHSALLLASGSLSFGKPSMDFYELRHFCGSWLFNDLELPVQDVAHELGPTDGGAFVQRLYGHPSRV